MKGKRFSVIIALLSVSAIFGGCSAGNTNTSSADWAYSFVVWNDYIYQISSENVSEVDEEIGEVTAYSDKEGSYIGNFSNEYEKGTKYYAITGISTEKAIAIKEEEGTYRKAIRDGEYDGN